MAEPPRSSRIGLGIVTLSVLVWMSVTVGPWWVGVIIFLVGLVFQLSAEKSHGA